MVTIRKAKYGIDTDERMLKLYKEKSEFMAQTSVCLE